MLDPGTSPADTGIRAIAVTLARISGKIWVGAARQSAMVPVTAPLPHIAVHVMKAPGIGGVTANFGRLAFGSSCVAT